MYDQHRELQKWARHERSKAVANFFADTVVGLYRLITKALRSSSASGTKSSALS